ncbi:MAG: hypothetical protein UY96_C0028G0010 [Parcubacteria group bacterium GW2011_GWB1_56_8]|nr:MAG: hypothetical protein UY96_C0028G0010 [Parcubacteria group bacterium GW2011_GWB1_56_8]
MVGAIVTTFGGRYRIPRGWPPLCRVLAAAPTSGRSGRQTAPAARLGGRILAPTGRR